MKLRLFSRSWSFVKQMPRRKLVVSVLVLCIAVSGVFLVTRQIFKADTVTPPSVASVSYLDSNNTNATVASNAISLNITIPTDPKAIIESKMATVVQIANACKAYAGIDAIRGANRSVFHITSAPPNSTTLSAGTEPICQTASLQDPGLTAATGNYPKLPDGYMYWLPGAFGFLGVGGGDTFVEVWKSPNGGAEGNKLSCSLSGCVKGTGW